MSKHEYIIATSSAPSMAPVRPTIGPRHSTQLVKPALIDELYALEKKFKQREKELDEERRELDGDRNRFEQAVAEKDWEIRRYESQFDAKRETWEQSHTQADATLDPASKDERLYVQASGAEPFPTNLETLVQREPGCGLAVAARTLWESTEDERTQAIMDGWGADAAAPLILYVDREPAITHLVIEWLRDGPKRLARLPRAVLEPLKDEALHWGMVSLEKQIEEALGKADATHEGIMELQFLIGELWLHKGRQPALCRAAAIQLRRFLAGGRSRRQLGVRAVNAVEALTACMEQHVNDGPLLAAGLGSCVLCGSEPEGQKQLVALKTRLEAIASVASKLGKAEAKELTGPAADAKAAAEEEKEVKELEDAEQRAQSAFEKAEARAAAREANLSFVEKALSRPNSADAKVTKEDIEQDKKELAAEAAAEEAEKEAAEEAAAPASEEAPAAEAEAAEAPAAEAPAAELPATEAPAAEAPAEAPAAEASAPAPAAEAPAPAEAAAAEATEAAEEAAGDARNDLVEETAEDFFGMNLPDEVKPAPKAGRPLSEKPPPALSTHHPHSIAAKALSVRERRANAKRLEQEADKMRRVLYLLRPAGV